MKNFIHPVLPALALLTLGSCAGTSALTTTESDGVYYSSKDRTTATAVASAAPAMPAETAPTAAGDVENPDYSENATASAGRGGNPEYYDDGYTYSSRIRRFHQPYRGMGLGYYDFVYTDPFWYGGPAYSPWGWGGAGFYDPFFYDPFWGPSMVNINIGFGRPWGWRRPWGWGASPFDHGFGWAGRPWGWGGAGWGGPGWGGGWGGGFYNGFYNGYYRGLNAGGGDIIVQPRVTGSRSSRSANAIEGFNGGSGRTSTATGSRSRSGGATETGGFVAPGDPTNTAGRAAASPSGGRGRSSAAYSEGSQPGATSPADSRVAETVPANQPTGGRRWRVLNETSGNEAGTAPASGAGYEPARSRRSSWGDANGTRRQAAETSGDVAEPRRERSYERPTRSYSEPSRSYSEPSRSYSQPSRSYSEPSRSYSPPSGGGYNGGGASGTRSGGGGGGRGRGN